MDEGTIVKQEGKAMYIISGVYCLTAAFAVWLWLFCGWNNLLMLILAAALLYIGLLCLGKARK